MPSSSDAGPTPGRSTISRRAVRWTGPIRTAATTARSSPSPTRPATAGSCRRSGDRSPARDPGSADLEQLDLEVEGGAGRDHRRGALIPIAQLGGDDEPAHAADAHP